MNLRCFCVLGLALFGGCGGKTTVGGSSSSGPGGACDDFLDQEGSATVTVRFRNNGSVPVFVPGGGCGSHPFSVNRVDGQDANVRYPFEELCLQTCEDLQTQQPASCAADCALVAYRIPPFGSRDFEWNGTGLRNGVEMAAECWAPGNVAPTCLQIVSAPPGSYRVEAIGFDSCETDCTCDDGGLCYGLAAGIQTTPPSPTFELGADLVEIVFSECAFGCPD